jgi:hypothetical protein
MKKSMKEVQAKESKGHEASDAPGVESKEQASGMEDCPTCGAPMDKCPDCGKPSGKITSIAQLRKHITKKLAE